MKKIKLVQTALVCFILMCESLFAQPAINLLKAIGGPGDDYCSDIKTDLSGNIYLTGSFRDSITLGNVTYYSQSHLPDLLIIKYDRAGNVKWVFTTGGTSEDQGVRLSIDQDRNIYLTGYFGSDTVYFGTIPLINVNPADPDAFIVKLDTSGNVIWAKSWGGIWSDVTSFVCSDWNGNTYITGYTRSPVLYFDGTPVNLNNGSYNMFIVKFDSSGNYQWLEYGKGYDSFGTNLSIDANNNIYATGFFHCDTLIIGADTLFNSSSGSQTADVYLLKFNSGGVMQWHQSFYGIDDDFSKSLCNDSSGNIILSGLFRSNTLYVGNIALHRWGYFLAKFDSGGTAIWAKDLQVPATVPSVITPANNNGFYVAGCFLPDTIYLDTFMLLNTYSGSNDLFVAKYDSAGTVNWALNAGGAWSEYGLAMCTDTFGDLIVGGIFNSYVFRIDNSEIYNTGNLTYDMFLLKFGQPILTEVTNSEKKNLISVYPDPCRERIYVKSDMEFFALQIIDQYGRIVFTDNEFSEAKSVFLNGVSAGIYFIKVKLKNAVDAGVNRTALYKFVKVN